MKKKITILVFLAVTMISCVVTSVKSSITPASPSPLPIETFTPTVINTLTANSRPTLQLTRTPVHLLGESFALCPEKRTIPLSELGLDPNMRLLVLPESIENEVLGDSIGLFTISPNEAVPHVVPNLVPDGMSNSIFYHVSPDGRWIVFNRKMTGSDGETTEVATISSLDGEQQWSLDSTGKSSVGYWLDDKTVLLFQKTQPVAIINPFTMEEDKLTNVPLLQAEGVGGIFFRNKNLTYLLYQTGENYGLFTPSTQMSQQVLDWLSSSSTSFLDRDFDITGDGKIVVRIKKSYGFDISPAMDIKDLGNSQNYVSIMKPVALPEYILSIDVSFVFKTIPAVVWQKTSAKNSLAAQIQFYTYNYEQQKLTDYCFDYKATNIQTLSISPDEKFIAFTFFHLPSTLPVPKSIIILNLETGFMTQIDGYQFVDWGYAN